MVAFSDLTQVMQNARTDAKTLDEYVHGAADTQVTSRLNKRYWTLATLDNKLSLVKIKAETTLADIDTLAKSATDSITAKSNSANTTIDNKAAQANSDIAAKVASANTAIDTQVASIDTRADAEINNLQSAINAAAAAGAGANGWTPELIAISENVNQRQINDGLDSIAQLLSVKNPRSGMRIDVKSYYAPNYALNKPFDNGGGTFVYDSTKATINDGGVIINGWLRQDTKQIFVNYFGAKGDGVTNDSPAFQKAVDYCEKNQIKTLRIGNGDYLLNDKVYFYRGGVNVIGEGALQREESWATATFVPYPDMLADRKGDAFSGCSVIVPKNSTAFVFAKSVVDHVFFSMLQFKAKEGRMVGNTNAIDFFAEFDGPTWGFSVNYCHFRGFNKIVNVKSPTQYCVAFVEMARNSFSQNDEVLYFADLPQDKWVNMGSRNMSWGLTFEHNRCHDNARLIRGCFAKDMVKISQNNLEGSISYADGTHPKYAIDLELNNCHVIFEGNHGESIAHNILFATSFFRKPDGTRHEFANNNTRGSAVSVTLKGNNFDGVHANIPITLEGVSIYNYDAYKVHIHGCSILYDGTSRLSYIGSEETKTEPTAFVFPLNSSLLSYTLDNDISTIGLDENVGKVDLRAFLMNTPFGERQVIECDNRENLFNYSMVSVRADTIYIGCSILINLPKEKVFFDAAADFFINYTLNGESVTYNMGFPFLASGMSLGWNVLTTYFPKAALPQGAIINSIAFGFALSKLLDSGKVLICKDVTTFTCSKPVLYPAPIYKNTNNVVVKKGTFEKGQMFLDETGVMNVCTKSGTISNTTLPTASGNVGDNFITVNNGKLLVTGNYISILGYSYSVVNVEGNKVYISAPFVADPLSNTPITFTVPEFKKVTLS